MTNKLKNHRSVFFYSIKIYIKLIRKHKLLFISATLFSLVFELLSVFSKFIFKIFIDQSTSFIQDEISITEFFNSITFLMILFFMSFIILIIGEWLGSTSINKLDTRLTKNLKLMVFDHLINLAYSFHTSINSGEIVVKIKRGCYAVEGLTDEIIYTIFGSFIYFLFSMISIFYLDYISAIVVLIISILLILYTLFITNFQKGSALKSNRIEELEHSKLSDLFSNISTIKFFAKESYIIRKYSQYADKTKNEFLKRWNYNRWLHSGNMLIVSIGMILIFYFGAINIRDSRTTIGSIAFIFTTYLTMVEYIRILTIGINDIYAYIYDFFTLTQYLNVKEIIKNEPVAKNIKITKNKIEFRDVVFKYENKLIIKNLNLIIQPKQKVAIIGTSGSGKTTLIKLLYRLYEINKGEILIDDINIKRFTLESLRSQLSIVPQECILFNDTIYNNILFSRLNAKKDDVYHAIKKARLEKLIERLPENEMTIVGERGIKMSAGERQRISIARAILADKNIVILDEATSSLDPETELEISESLTELLKNKTAIIIAHRLSTIINSDVIVMMKDGKIIDKGTHKELYDRCQLYKKYFDIQTIKQS